MSYRICTYLKNDVLDLCARPYHPWLKWKEGVSIWFLHMQIWICWRHPVHPRAWFRSWAYLWSKPKLQNFRGRSKIAGISGDFLHFWPQTAGAQLVSWLSEPKPQNFEWFHGFLISGPKALWNLRSQLCRHNAQVFTMCKSWHTTWHHLLWGRQAFMPSPKEHEQVQVHARSCNYQGIHMHQLGSEANLQLLFS